MQYVVVDPELLKEKWLSILYHVVNKHKWSKATKFHRCAHGRLSRAKARQTKWLKIGSPAHIALEEVVTNKKLLNDITKLSDFHHTGGLEVFHALLLKYAPKRTHFSYNGMTARTQLAIIDHSNVNGKQALVKRGQNKNNKRYNVVFPKGKKQWIAKPIKQEKSYSFVQELMRAILANKGDARRQTKLSQPKTIPKNIAAFPCPSKEQIINMHKSRMAKK